VFSRSCFVEVGGGKGVFSDWGKEGKKIESWLFPERINRFPFLSSISTRFAGVGISGRKMFCN